MQIKNYSEQVHTWELRGSWGKQTDPLKKMLVLGNIFMWGSVLVIRLRRNGGEAVGHFSLRKQGVMYTGSCSEHDPFWSYLQERGNKIQTWRRGWVIGSNLPALHSSRSTHTLLLKNCSWDTEIPLVSHTAPAAGFAFLFEEEMKRGIHLVNWTLACWQCPIRAWLPSRCLTPRAVHAALSLNSLPSPQFQ